MEDTIVDSLLLFLAVVASGWLARGFPIRIPLPLVQMAVGGLIAATTGLGFELDPEVFFLLFLPPLLFLDGWRVPKEGLVKEARSIGSLAFGLVVFSVLGIGYLAHWLMPTMPLPVAFALAAALSPTDAVAVGAIMSKSAAPRRLMSILQGEALLNDASGLVCMRFAVAAVATGAFALSTAGLTFLWIAGVGICIGILTTLVATSLHGRIIHRFGDDVGSSILLSLLVPFGAYLLAEQLDASAILAAVAAGMTMAFAEQTGRASAITRTRRIAVWDMVAFALNGAMFVLVGEQLPEIIGLAQNALHDTTYAPTSILVPLLVITLALFVLRFIWVTVVLGLLPFIQRDAAARPSLRFLLVATIAGARGSVTLAAILTLPLTVNDAPFPARDLAIVIAAGVVILSMALAGMTLPHLLRGLPATPEAGRVRIERRARTAGALAAIEAIGQAQHDEHSASGKSVSWMEAAARISSEYRTRIDGMEKSGEDAAALQQAEAIDQNLRLVALRAERATYYRLGRELKLEDDIVRELVEEVDDAETRMGRVAVE